MFLISVELLVHVQYDSHDGVAINASSVTDYYYTSLREPVVFDMRIPEKQDMIPS